MSKRPADFSDKEILELFKKKESCDYAFRLIVEKYQEKLYGHIRKILISHEDTDDTLQNVFIKAWSALPSFREDSGLFTWLYRIATNESLTYIRNKKRRFLFSLTDVEKKWAESLANDPYFNGDELQLRLQKAILTLPGKQRIVFNMKYFDEMKYEDMAEILDTSVGALKASYHHAMKKIEKIMTSD